MIIDKAGEPNLVKCCLDTLYVTLENFFRLEKDAILRAKTKNPDRTTFDFWQDQLVYIGPAAGDVGKVMLHIGFPFPIESRDLGDANIPPGYDWHIFARGQELRKLQFQQLVQSLDDAGYDIKIENLAVNSFQDTVQNVMKCSSEEILYIDPYNNPNETHLGNSFIGLYFLKSLVGKDFRKVRCLSSSWEHLRFLIPNILPKNVDQLCQSLPFVRVVVMPDLLDGRWTNSIEFMHHVLAAYTPVCVPGRDIILRRDSDKSLIIYRLQRNNVLLRDSSIDLYNPTLFMTDARKKGNAPA